MSRLILSLLLVIAFTKISFAGWTGPDIIITGQWGSSVGEFGIEIYDTGYNLPDLSAVVSDGKVLIHDGINGKMLVFHQDGKLFKEVHYEPAINEKGQKVRRLPEYGISQVKRFMRNGNMWIGAGSRAWLVDPTGKIIAKYEKRPLESGIKTARRRAATDSKYEATVRYEDRTFLVILDANWVDYVRDQNDNLFFFDSYTAHDPVSDESTVAWFVAKFDRCGNRLAKLSMPVSEYEPLTSEQEAAPVSFQNKVRNEYGPPVIGPDGSVYAFKRTPGTYSILKWTWVDEPGDPKSECKK